MNTCRQIEVTTGAHEIEVGIPADVAEGDLLVVANLPIRVRPGILGWIRLRTSASPVTALIRTASDADAGIVFVFPLIGHVWRHHPTDDPPQLLVIRDFPHVSHFDERNIEIALPDTQGGSS